MRTSKKSIDEGGQVERQGIRIAHADCGRTQRTEKGQAERFKRDRKDKKPDGKLSKHDSYQRKYCTERSCMYCM